MFSGKIGEAGLKVNSSSNSCRSVIVTFLYSKLHCVYFQNDLSMVASFFFRTLSLLTFKYHFLRLWHSTLAEDLFGIRSIMVKIKSSIKQGYHLNFMLAQYVTSQLK